MATVARSWTSSTCHARPSGCGLTQITGSLAGRAGRAKRGGGRHGHHYGDCKLRMQLWLWRRMWRRLRLWPADAVALQWWQRVAVDVVAMAAVVVAPPLVVVVVALPASVYVVGPANDSA